MKRKNILRHTYDMLTSRIVQVVSGCMDPYRFSIRNNLLSRINVVLIISTKKSTFSANHILIIKLQFGLKKRIHAIIYFDSYRLRITKILYTIYIIVA